MGQKYYLSKNTTYFVHDNKIQKELNKQHTISSGYCILCRIIQCKHTLNPQKGTLAFGLFVCLMVFNATFNNISVISWRSVLLVEQTTDLSQVTDKHYHIMLYTSPRLVFELTRSVVIGTDCIGSCKSFGSGE